MRRNGARRLHAALILVLFSLVLVSVGFEQADAAVPFVVNDAGDLSDAHPGDGSCATSTNKCTLRAAIEEANAHAGPDSITIPAMTIVVSRELKVQAAYAGTNNADVTITGAGESRTIIDGNHVTRVLHFDWTTDTASVSDLTVRNANTTDASEPSGDFYYSVRAGRGGAILNESHHLTISRVTIVNNQARQGAGIYSTFTANWQFVHELVLDSVTLRGNIANGTTFGYGGGGLFNGSKLVGTHVTMTENGALQGGGYYNNSTESATLTDFDISNNIAKDGGGIDNDGGLLLKLEDGVISGNLVECCRNDGSSGGGGGIFHNAGTLELSRVRISSNAATGSGGYGGGLFSNQNATLDHVAITGNRAAQGAGIYNGNYSNQPNALTVTNATIAGNVGLNSKTPYVESSGAGLYSSKYGRAMLTNVTITGNSAVAGGGIENQVGGSSTVTLRNTILASNSASGYGPDCHGVITSGGYNILGSNASCSFSAKTGDQANVNAMLFPLQDNGGDTLTLAPRPGSAAIDKGSNVFCPTTDQRGSARPVDGNSDGQATCDIGAYETTPFMLTALSPSRGVTGSRAFTLRVIGLSFKSGLVVNWSGQSRPTTYVSPTELDAAIGSADVNADGVAAITVADPTTRAALSNSLAFHVTAPLSPRAFLPTIVNRN